MNIWEVLNQLFKNTQMQTSFGAIMLALVDGEPKILQLRDFLHVFVEHRKDVISFYLETRGTTKSYCIAQRTTFDIL